jgi:hypothetical protein
VFFKRSPVKDIGGALLNFENSSMLKLFDECAALSDNGEACLFIVGGKHSICVTNMQTDFAEAVCDLVCRRPDSEVHVFKATDAWHRLHNLFHTK